MRRFEFISRIAASLGLRPWLGLVLALLCLNAGVFAWTQGALSDVVWLSAFADEPPEPEISPHSIRLITPEEAAQLQARLAIEAREAQAAAQAAAMAPEVEMLLEFEPAPKLPKRPSKIKALRPIVKLKPRNQRGQSAP